VYETDANTVQDWKMERALAYDVGMHNGDDSHYYLAKGFDVIGIDANPVQCRNCAIRFRDEIAAGRMIILNEGVGPSEGTLDFYINEVQDSLSTFAPEKLGESKTIIYSKEQLTSWKQVYVKTRKLSSIVAEYGSPTVVKLDVEHFDHLVLLDLLETHIAPPYISSEVQTIDPFCALVCMGYERFKLLDGSTVGEKFGDHEIATLDGRRIRHSFTQHSSGPLADDLPGQWLDKDEALLHLMLHGVGWIDVHARHGD
jgi:FkbM family methyltransferase